MNNITTTIITLLLPALLLANNPITQSVQWLNDNLKEVRHDKTVYSQQFKTNSANFDHMTVTQQVSEEKGGGSMIEYQFYPGHLNPNKTTFEVHKTEINVILYAKEGHRVIKRFKDGQLSAFKSKIVLRADDPQLAKDVIDQVNQIIENTSYQSVELAEEDQAINWLTQNIKDIGLQDAMTKQNFKHFPDKRNKLTLNVTSGKTHWQYDFYASDFNAYSGKFDNDGDQFVIKFNTIDNQKMVKIFRDGEQQKFNNYFKLHAIDAKNAMDILEAFKVAFGGQPTENPNKTTNSNNGLKSTIRSTVSNTKEAIANKHAKKNEQTVKEFSNCEFERNEMDPFTNKKSVTTSSGLYVKYTESAKLVFGLHEDKLYAVLSHGSTSQSALETTLESRMWFRTNNDEVIELNPARPHVGTLNRSAFSGNVSSVFKPEFNITKEQLEMIASSSIKSFRIAYKQGVIQQEEINTKNQGKIQKSASCLLSQL